MRLPEKESPVCWAIPWELLAPCQRILEETVAESKESTRFSLGVGNKRAEAGRDGTAEPLTYETKFSAANRGMKIDFPWQAGLE